MKYVLPLLLLLAACDPATFQQPLRNAGVDPQVALANACSSWAKAVDAVAARLEAGQLEAKKAMQVGEWSGEVRPVCTDQAHAGIAAVALVGSKLVDLAGVLN